MNIVIKMSQQNRDTLHKYADEHINNLTDAKKFLKWVGEKIGKEPISQVHERIDEAQPVHIACTLDMIIRPYTMT